MPKPSSAGTLTASVLLALAVGALVCLGPARAMAQDDQPIRLFGTVEFRG